MKNDALDALDLRLISALQARPRASWSSLAQALGSSDATLARRWETLKDEGVAWMTVAPNLSLGHGSLAMGMALVEVRVKSGCLTSTAASLAAHPEIATIEVTAGARSLMLTVIAGSPQALSDFLLDSLDAHPFVDGIRSYPASWTYRDASRWRVFAGAAGDQHDRRARPGARTRPRLPHRDLAESIAAVLAQDGRATADHVAKALDIGIRTARTGLAQLTASGEIRFRTEVSRALAGWPVCAWFLVSSSAAHRERDVRTLAAMPECRAVMHTIGPFDLAAVTWMRELADVDVIEAAIEDNVPPARIHDRVLVLRTVKLMGRVLDTVGRSEKHIPLPVYLNLRG
ncbi:MULTISPECIES: Lrp/AsnC family transcriptional regulator [unclassified Microbacterium]|uniref:Lrp/AsnC family transcriptional regulator n=1 Tax=unclassified Microbacterium TaxID=2609290 RepID=UPI000492F0CF|nr:MULTISPECIES: Lrp/AsnC ligand binding domain-containing protein [unclassified Microbacterium]